MYAPSSSITTLAWVLPLVGIAIFLATLAPVRDSWSKRTKRAHEWLYHPAERGEVKEVEEAPTESATLLNQIEPNGWDYSIYKDRDADR